MNKVITLPLEHRLDSYERLTERRVEAFCDANGLTTYGRGCPHRKLQTWLGLDRPDKRQAWLKIESRLDHTRMFKRRDNGQTVIVIEPYWKSDRWPELVTLLEQTGRVRVRERYYGPRYHDQECVDIFVTSIRDEERLAV